MKRVDPFNVMLILSAIVFGFVLLVDMWKSFVMVDEAGIPIGYGSYQACSSCQRPMTPIAPNGFYCESCKIWFTPNPVTR